MAPTSRLYNALNDFLPQCDIVWQDARHLQTLCWMMIGMIQSQNVHLNGFGVYVVSRDRIAQSHQRRFRRWLSNRRIDVVSAHHTLIGQALSQWRQERLYLSLDTTLVWNCFCIVWIGVVYRGRTIPIAWRIVAQSSSTVRLWTIQRVLRQATRVMPTGVAIVLLADRAGLCRWQVDEVSQREPGLAFSYPHQALIPVSDGGAVAQGVLSVLATGTSLLYPSGIHW